MGRKTYESIGRPLPGRITVIVSRDPAYRVAGCLTAHSPEEAIRVGGDDAEVFFVGGAELYAQALPLADRLYLTEIQADFAGDARFPPFDRAEWVERQRERRESADRLAYHFVVYERAG
jgi:dihydrofolate reductase